MLSNVVTQRYKGRVYKQRAQLFTFNNVSVRPMLQVVHNGKKVSFTSFKSLQRNFSGLIYLFLRNNSISTHLILRVGLRAISRTMPNGRQEQRNRRHNVKGVQDNNVGLSSSVVSQLPLSLALLPIFRYRRVRHLQKAKATRERANSHATMFGLTSTIRATISALRRLAYLDRKYTKLHIRTRRSHPNILFKGGSHLYSVSRRRRRPREGTCSTPRRPSTVSGRRRSACVTSTRAIRSNVRHFARANYGVILNITLLVSVKFRRRHTGYQ